MADRTRAVCTWGEGPDVLVVIKPGGEWPLRPSLSEQEGAAWSFGLSVREAELLAEDIQQAVVLARELAHPHPRCSQCGRALDEEGHCVVCPFLRIGRVVWDVYVDAEGPILSVVASGWFEARTLAVELLGVGKERIHVARAPR